MIAYLLIGTIMFAEWEQWNYLDSLYFCFTSLTKIGFGDFVPGASLHVDQNGSSDRPDPGDAPIAVAMEVGGGGGGASVDHDTADQVRTGQKRQVFWSVKVTCVRKNDWTR